MNNGKNNRNTATSKIRTHNSVQQLASIPGRTVNYNPNNNKNERIDILGSWVRKLENKIETINQNISSLNDRVDTFLLNNKTKKNTNTPSRSRSRSRTRSRTRSRRRVNNYNYLKKLKLKFINIK